MTKVADEISSTLLNARRKRHEPSTPHHKDRSLTSTISATSEEMTTTPTPSDVRFADGAIDVLSGTRVDPPRGLIEDDDARACRERLGQHDFLLVAAAERPRDLVWGGKLDMQTLDELIGQRGCVRLTQETERPSDNRPAVTVCALGRARKMPWA